MYYKVTLEYDGKAFHGSQAQAAARGRTVQGELERALAQVTGTAIRIVLAGRTDAGVHALGQVASFALDPAWPRAKLFEALNGVLPGDLKVRTIDRAADGFHARYDANRRDYRYLIWQAPAPAPLLRDRTWHVAQGAGCGGDAPGGAGVAGAAQLRLVLRRRPGRAERERDRRGAAQHGSDYAGRRVLCLAAQQPV